MSTNRIQTAGQCAGEAAGAASRQALLRWSPAGKF